MGSNAERDLRPQIHLSSNWKKITADGVAKGNSKVSEKFN